MAAIPTTSGIPAALPPEPEGTTAQLTSQDEPRRRRSGNPRAPRNPWSRALLWLVLLVVAATFMYPLIWLLSASLKNRGQVFNNSLLPSPVAWENYAQVWDELPLANWLGTSLAIAVLAAVFVAVSSSMVAFGFAYFRFPGRGFMFGLVLATMMLPGAVTMVPVYLIWKQVGLLGTWVPLFGANLFGSAFYIFLQRQFFLGLPRELFEAARIDGAGHFRLFTRIAMPLAVPSFVIVLLFEFQASWNNLQGALIYLNARSPEDFTAPLGIAYAMTKYSPTAGGHGDYQYVMAASLIVTLPMLVLFAFGQRYFVEGISTTGRTG